MQSSEQKTFLSQNPLFVHLSAQQIENILKISSVRILNKGDYLVKEGDIAAEFFLIFSGEVEIVKADRTHQRTHVLSKLSAGDSIGEMALFDQGARSASVRAASLVEVLEIPFGQFHELAKHDPVINQVLLEIARHLSLRMRQTNDTTIQALEKQLSEYKLRVALGIFMVNSIVALCLFTFALSGLNYFNQTALSSSFITIPVTLVFFISFLLVIKSSQLPKNVFGLTLKDWRISIFEALFFTAIACLFTILLKWILIHTLSAYHNQPLFKISQYFAGTSTDSVQPFSSIWWILVLVYCFLTAPLQELLARGGMQGPLEIFLTGQHRRLKAILVSNLMFSTAHLFLSLKVTLIIFFAGLYFGWLYNRHKNIIGVTVAHAILGIWGIEILGF